MFQAEINVEDRTSSAGPMLLIGAVCLTIVATAVYVVHEARKGMSETEARHVVTAMLDERGAATVHFRTGLVMPSPTDKPTDLQYQLLERAQVITREKQGGGMHVTLTDNGAKLLAGIAGTIYTRNSDGTDEYLIPLGTREVISVTGVNVISPSSATIHYTWKWRPTSMGDIFDLAGNYATGFNVWERASLAKDYGADLYHGEPVADEYNATSGWQLARN